MQEPTIAKHSPALRASNVLTVPFVADTFVVSAGRKIEEPFTADRAIEVPVP